ncbi:MAG: T9SS type A sorting domain-containing protein [Bacteroidetes bacterium]|nr:T9SS type A sorting domain-containing protein [Bacteroidota bacterium]
MKKTLLLFGIAILLSVSAISQVFTSGFENWTTTAPIKPTDWVGTKTSLGSDSIFQVTTGAHGGTYACKLQNRTSTHKRFTTQAVAITAGKSYTITFWAKGHGEIRTSYWKGAGSGGDQYGAYNAYIIVNSDTWALQTQTVAVDTTSALAEFILSIRNTNADKDHLQVDDVTISEATTSTVTIHDIQYSTDVTGVSPLAGQVVTTSGIVTGKYHYGYFIQDGTGQWNGIFVLDSVHTVSLGDSVTLTGSVYEYYTFTELKNITAFTVNSSSNTLPTPLVVTGATFETEGNEGILVKLNDAECVKVNAGYGMWKVDDGTDSTKIHNLLYAFVPTLGTHYDITGPTYYSYNEYRIEPRDANDVQISTGINEFKQAAISVYPNPATSNIYINNISGVNIIKISNILGETIQNINISGNNTDVNVNSLPNGLYFITLLNDNGIVATKKFVKQ